MSPGYSLFVSQRRLQESWNVIGLKVIGWSEDRLHIMTQTVVLDGHKSNPWNVFQCPPRYCAGPTALSQWYWKTCRLDHKVLRKRMCPLPMYTDDGECTALQNDLRRLTEWSNTWIMSFNINKCVPIMNKINLAKPAMPYCISISN